MHLISYYFSLHLLRLIARFKDRESKFAHIRFLSGVSDNRQIAVEIVTRGFIYNITRSRETCFEQLINVAYLHFSWNSSLIISYFLVFWIDNSLRANYNLLKFDRSSKNHKTVCHRNREKIKRLINEERKEKRSIKTRRKKRLKKLK